MSKVQENTAKTSTIAVLKKTEFLGKTLTVFGTVAFPLFFAKEIADWLEHTNVSKMLLNIDPDEKVLQTNITNSYGGQNAWFLTEYGLYEVLMQSRKPIAKEFKKGVKKILSDIRQEGYYATPSMTAATDCFGDDYKAKHIAFLNGLIEHKDKQMLRLLDVMNDMSLQIKDLKAAQTDTAASASAPKPLPYKRIRVISKSTINGKPLTLFGTPDNVLFIAKEVADWLSVCSVPNMMRYVSEGNKQQLNNPCSFSGRHAWFVTEKGLDELFERYGFYLDCNTQPFENGVRHALAAVRG